MARANSAHALSLDPPVTVSAPARPLSRSQTIRRQKIINVALSMLETRNSDQLQMRDISQSANLALATVYRYFPSKELLLARVFEQWCEGYWTRLARAADGRANIDRLIDLASRSVEAYESHPNILVMISALELSDPDSNIVFRHGNCDFGIRLPSGTDVRPFNAADFDRSDCNRSIVPGGYADPPPGELFAVPEERAGRCSRASRSP